MFNSHYLAQLMKLTFPSLLISLWAWTNFWILFHSVVRQKPEICLCFQAFCSQPFWNPRENSNQIIQSLKLTHFCHFWGDTSQSHSWICRTTWRRVHTKTGCDIKLQLLRSSRLQAVLGWLKFLDEMHPVIVSSVFNMACECRCQVFLAYIKATGPHLL